MHSNHQFDELYSLNSIDQHFNKQYTFSNLNFSQDSDNLNEIEFEERFIDKNEWKIEQLQLIEENLNRVKSKLNNYNGREWSLFTNKFCLLNIYCSYQSFNKYSKGQNYQSKPELFTRAWIKLHEILVKFDFKNYFLNNVTSKEVNCLCLCEAPGAFVTSLNHFLKQNLSNEYKLNWLATSLNPYYEANDYFKDTLTEDGFIEKTFDRWYFGEDNSGDIQQANFYQLFTKVFKDKCVSSNISSTKVHLITGDGGMRNIEFPQLQEINSFILILNEALVALNCLSDGGCLILKIFSFYNCRTISLIYLLVCLFEKVHLIKPISSKEGNNEIYLVCINYLLNKNIRLVQQMTARFNRSKIDKSINEQDIILFRKEMIPADFLEKIVDYANLFALHQTTSIERNIYLFEQNDKKFYYKYQKLQLRIDEKFKKLVNLNPIKIDDQLIKEFNQINFKKNHYYFGLNKNQLISYDTSNSYSELIEQMNEPEKKLDKIRKLISSMYLKPKKKLFDLFNDFYRIDHHSEIVNLDEYIKQPKSNSMKKFSNTKLCCENLIKLSSDFDSLSKPLNVNVDHLRDKLNSNHEMILNQFKRLFSLKLNELDGSLKKKFILFDHVQADITPNLSSLLLKSIEHLKVNSIQLDTIGNQNFEKTDIILHLIDLFNIRDVSIDNSEYNLINHLILKLNEIMIKLKYDHIIVISLPSFYSRYAFGLIYLCTFIFRDITISPFYLRSNDLKAGLIFVMTNCNSSITNLNLKSRLDIDNCSMTNDSHLKRSKKKSQINPNDIETQSSDIEVNNNLMEIDVSKLSKEEFERNYDEVKKIIGKINCHNFTDQNKQILDFIGIHKIMKETKYIDFFQFIILANNLNLIENLKLKMIYSS